MAQETGTPKVITNVTNGNLLRQVNITDGVAGIVATAKTAGLIGKVNTVYGLDDAVKKGYTEAAEPFIFGILNEFYTELGGSQELWVLGTEDTMTMAQAVTSTNNNGAKKLLTVSQGRVNLVGIMRDPALAYDAGEEFLDTDVSAAVIASKALAEYQQSINRPVRFLISGRVANTDVANTYNPNTASNGYAGVVLGNVLSDGRPAVPLALARAVKYEAHIKIGSGEKGALSINSAYIGDRPIEEYTPTELDAFASAGFMVLHIREGISGFFFGRDNMCSDDDFRILVYGRLIDKAQRISTATTAPFVETDVRITPDGKINDADATYMEQTVKTQLLAQMGDQISGVDCIISLDQDLINTNTLEMQVKIQPLGYLTWIIINLGLTKTI
ncbi:hypothetical protein AP75_01900 [Kaistella haifensis DSM 19056]|uniref:Phage tail protein n=1 Tax=Kaistella haifensis DSM 19056 TaxID=1450526 RepID=A0A246BC56_9FLAO|nr:DUF2586 family protein [Kaistella haifensis]OWK99264.1 hypothetical protein AP75_01900 [Kaistella haifensis DSM 19056]